MDYNESSSIHSGLYKSGYLTQRGFQKEDDEEEGGIPHVFCAPRQQNKQLCVRERLARVAQSRYQDQQCTVGDFLHDGVHLPHAPSAVTDLC